MSARQAGVACEMRAACCSKARAACGVGKGRDKRWAGSRHEEAEGGGERGMAVQRGAAPQARL